MPHQFLTIEKLEELVNAPTAKIPQQPASYEPLTHMIFTCRSHSPEAVKQSLIEADLSSGEFRSMGANISIFYDDDLCYFDLNLWSGMAVGCCLITQPHFER